MNDSRPAISSQAPTILDTRGWRCPIPVIRMEAALRRLKPGARLKIIADDPVAAVDIPHFARAAGATAERLPPDPGAAPGLCVFLVTAGGKRDSGLGTRD